MKIIKSTINYSPMKKHITFLLALASAGVFAQSSSGTKTAAAATKRVLIEEATGTWCGWCVRGICMTDDLNKKHPSTTAIVAVHNGDPMKVTAYDNGMAATMKAYFGSNWGYPGGFVDRLKTTSEVDPEDFEAEYNKRITYATPVDVFIDNVAWNSTTRALTFKVNATTVAALNGTYKFNAVITEMQVHGTTTQYDQHNYYDDGSSGPMCGFESKPDPVPAAQMYYDFVGRAIMAGWDGTAGSIPASVPVGQTVSYTYSTTVPAGWNEKNLTLIGFVINSSNGSVENCSKTTLVPTAIGENFKTEFVAYPNPTTGIVSIRNSDPLDITVFNVMGEVVKAEKHVSRIDLSSLEDGIYFLRFNNGNNTSTQKFILAR